MATVDTKSCPACRHPLAAAALGTGTAYACGEARHGCWFPAGILERAVGHLRPRKRTSPPAFREAGVGTLGPGDGCCPDDGTPLTRAIWGDAVFARCGTCAGLWIGADALQTIVAEVRGERVTPKPRDPEDSVLLAILSSI